MSTSINNDVTLKGSIGISVIKNYEKILNILVCIHINTNTALRTSISTNVCKGFSIVLASAFHISIGTHVCKGFSIVLTIVIVCCWLYRRIAFVLETSILV